MKYLSCILFYGKLFKSNLSKDEVSTLRSLNDSPDTICLKGNKGNTSIIMNPFDYKETFIDHLSSSSYKPLFINPLNKFLRIVSNAVKSSSRDITFKKWLLPHNPQPSNFFGQPKFHKKDKTLRPIINIIRAPTHALSRQLSNKLLPFTTQISSFINDSTNFMKKIIIFIYRNKNSWLALTWYPYTPKFLFVKLLISSPNYLILKL